MATRSKPGARGDSTLLPNLFFFEEMHEIEFNNTDHDPTTVIDFGKKIALEEDDYRENYRFCKKPGTF